MIEPSEFLEQRRKARVMTFMLGVVALVFFFAYIALGVLKS